MYMLLLGLFLAAAVFGARLFLRRRGDQQLQSRVTIVFAALIIVTAFGLFAATQFGLIPNHAP
jgi:predicted PurR-regulated permease PerM